jgi:hypothetical protein
VKGLVLLEPGYEYEPSCRWEGQHWDEYWVVVLGSGIQLEGLLLLLLLPVVQILEQAPSRRLSVVVVVVAVVLEQLEPRRRLVVRVPARAASRRFPKGFPCYQSRKACPIPTTPCRTWACRKKVSSVPVHCCHLKEHRQTTAYPLQSADDCWGKPRNLKLVELVPPQEVSVVVSVVVANRNLHLR